MGSSAARSNCVVAKSTAASSARASCSRSSSRTMRLGVKRQGDIGQALHRLLRVPVMMDACMSRGEWTGRPCVHRRRVGLEPRARALPDRIAGRRRGGCGLRGGPATGARARRGLLTGPIPPPRRPSAGPPRCDTFFPRDPERVKATRFHICVASPLPLIACSEKILGASLVDPPRQGRRGETLRLAPSVVHSGSPEAPSMSRRVCVVARGPCGACFGSGA